MSHPRRRFVLPCVVAGVLALAGCSTDAGTGEDPSPTSDPVTASPVAGGSQPVSFCQAPPPLPSEVPTFEPRQAPTDEPSDLLYATLDTNCGPIEIELFGSLAPVTVASFAFLAQEGYWVDSPCHRLTTAGIFVLQCGDPTGTGRGGPGYTFGIENAPEDGVYPRGVVAMARTADPHSNSGQYFIVYDETRLPVNDGGYSVFGRVTSGMDIIDAIAEQGVDGGGADGLPTQRISVLQVEVTEQKASES